VHGRLKVVRLAQLNIDPDMVRETADEQVRFLVWQKVVGVADEFIEALLVLLDRSREGKARQLGEAVGAHRRAEPLVAQFREAIPCRYTLVDLQGVVPRLGDSRQVVRGEPDAVSRRRLLSAEFATAQPVQRIDGTVVGGELQLAEARNAQPLECAAAGAAERGCW
jgi:hypothetical protein